MRHETVALDAFKQSPRSMNPTQIMDARIAAPSISQDGRIRIPGIQNAIGIGAYRRMVGLFSRILEAKTLVDAQKEALSLDGVTPPEQALTALQPSNSHPGLFYKREDQTQTRAYKLRGAYVAMHQAMTLQNQTKFLAVSTGNHALGVLRAAEILKPQAVGIVVPHNTAACKLERMNQRIEGLKAQGVDAQLVFQGQTFDEARTWALAEAAQQHDVYYLDPYSDPWVVAGQGTIGLELFEQLKTLLSEKPEVTEVVVVAPVGGGGLLGGLSTGLKMAAAWDPAFRNVNVRLLGLQLDDHSAPLGDAIRVKSPASVNRMLFASLGVNITTMDNTAMAQGMATVEADIQTRVEGASGGTVWPSFNTTRYELAHNRLVVSVLSGGNVH